MLTCWCSAAIKFAIFTILVHLRLKCNLKKKKWVWWKVGLHLQYITNWVQGPVFLRSRFPVQCRRRKISTDLEISVKLFSMKAKKKRHCWAPFFLHLAKRFLSDPAESLGTTNVHASTHFKKSKSWDIHTASNWESCHYHEGTLHGCT